MRTARCPECGMTIRVSTGAEVGDEITCPFCSEELEVVDTDPLTLGYLGGFIEELDDELEDELEDEFEEEDDYWEGLDEE